MAAKKTSGFSQNSSSGWERSMAVGQVKKSPFITFEELEKGVKANPRYNQKRR